MANQRVPQHRWVEQYKQLDLDGVDDAYVNRHIDEWMDAKMVTVNWSNTLDTSLAAFKSLESFEWDHCQGRNVRSIPSVSQLSLVFDGPMSMSDLGDREELLILTITATSIRRDHLSELPSLPRLKDLTLVDCYRIPSSSINTFITLQMFHRKRWLEQEYRPLKDAALIPLINIVSLDINDETELTNRSIEGMTMLADIRACNVVGITSLDMCSRLYCVECPNSSIVSISQRDRLRSLTCGYCLIDGDSLRDSPRLKSLMCSGCSNISHHDINTLPRLNFLHCKDCPGVDVERLNRRARNALAPLRGH